MCRGQISYVQRNVRKVGNVVGPSRSRFPWWVYLGGYAGTYFALGFAYPLIAGETLPKTLYRLSIEK